MLALRPILEDPYRPLGISPNSPRAETTQRALGESAIFETRMALLRQALFQDLTDAALLAQYQIALQNWARWHLLAVGAVLAVMLTTGKSPADQLLELDALEGRFGR